MDNLKSVKMDNLKMLHDSVLVKPDEEENTTSGGVMLTDSMKKKSTTGKVIAVGKGVMNGDGKLVEPSVKKGDTILYRKWSGTELSLKGEEFVLMKDSDIVAIVGG